MQRILLAIGGAAVFCAAVTVLLQIVVARGLPVTDIVLVTSSATLLLSVGASVLAFRAYKHASLGAAELERLTRSMDAAIKEVSLRSDRDAARIEDLNALVSDKLGHAPGRKAGHRGHPAEDADGAAPAEPRPRAAARRGKPTSSTGESPEDAAIDLALRRMVAGGQADLSMQPIIAAGRGEAGGFELHFHVQPEEGKAVDLRRLPRDVADVDPAGLERLAVVSASEAARRRLSDIGDRKPVHVAVSAALLDDEMELATVLDIFKLHPALARSIVLSLPSDLLETDGHATTLATFSELGVGLAAEDWSGSKQALDAMKGARSRMVKVPAERLLDRTKPRKSGPNGAALVQMAGEAGADIIATDVQSEEDAVRLIEMSVDLMTGERLSAPRRLEPETAGARRVRS